jgi:hypothetical protein
MAGLIPAKSDLPVRLRGRRYPGADRARCSARKYRHGDSNPGFRRERAAS